MKRSMASDRRRTPRRGFTLVELLLAGMIAAMVLVTVVVTLSQIGRAREVSRARLLAHLRADAALDAIRGDLTSVLRDADLFHSRVLLYDGSSIVVADGERIDVDTMKASDDVERCARHPFGHRQEKRSPADGRVEHGRLLVQRRGVDEGTIEDLVDDLGWRVMHPGVVSLAVGGQRLSDEAGKPWPPRACEHRRHSRVEVERRWSNGGWARECEGSRGFGSRPQYELQAGRGKPDSGSGKEELQCSGS